VSTILGLLHGLDYLLSSGLVGSLIFSALIESSAGQPAVIRFSRSRAISLVLASATLLVSAIWLVLVAADMAESWNLSDLMMVATSTSFGHLSACKLAVVLAVLLLAFSNLLFRFWWVALALPLCFSLSGHAGAEKAGAFTSVAIDAVHLLTVSIWTGGLVSLLLWLRARLRGTDASAYPNASILVVTRFSHFAMVSTALIGVTGVIMALRFGVSLTSPWASDYGKLVLVKIALFTAALGAASINQFIHMKGWGAERETQFTRSVYREIHFELVAVWVVFFVVGFLTRMPPPGHAMN
jgi:putative copper export protein